MIQEQEEEIDFSKESYWNDKLEKEDIKFEYVVCLYGQGDCFFSLLDEKDWKTVKSAHDPCEGLALIRPSRTAYFSNVMKLIEFCQANQIVLRNSCHGCVY